MNIKYQIRDIRSKVIGILIIIWLLAIIKNPKVIIVLYPIISVIFFSLCDLVFRYIKTKKLFYPLSSVISGFLIGLILDPAIGLIPILIAVIIAFISKHYLKLSNSHIFNPAAFGIFFSSLLFKLPVSWWAVSYSGIHIIPLLFSFLLLFKLKRFHLPIIFLLGYFIYLYITGNLQSAWILTFDGTVLLFSLIMLPEPMTTSIMGMWKYIYSIIVLCLVIFLNYAHFTSIDPLLLSLLISNFISKIIIYPPKKNR